MSLEKENMFLRSNTNRQERIVWFDIETTGFNIFHNEIIELSAIDNLGNSFSSLISITKGLPKKITEITNITFEMLKGQPSEQDVLTRFVKFLNGDVVPNLDYTVRPTRSMKKTKWLIGHNILAFDIPFVKAQCQKHNIDFPETKLIDTMRMAQFILPEKYSYALGALCEIFALQSAGAHRAMNDVLATQAIYNSLCTLYRHTYDKCSPQFICELTTVQ